MSEKAGVPLQAEEDLILLIQPEVAKMLRFSADGFSNWLGDDSAEAQAFKAVPFITRGRTKLWRKSDVRRYVESQVKGRAA